jgi:hypothetical protein
MELIPRTSGCEDGNCPGVSDVIDDGLEDMAAVQGSTLTGLAGIPGHESVVLVPRRILLEYADKVRTETPH